jgi:thymidylate synthase
MKQYKDLINRVLDAAQVSPDRTGVGTLFKFGESIEIDLQDQFPIVTLRKIDYTQAFGELAAFLKGATSKKEFSELGCNYWNSTKGVDTDDNLGPIYGAQWVNFNGVNQLQELVTSLKENPYSRRHILSTWNPADLHKMALPPCHITAQFNIHEGELSCIVYMRSVDIMLGLPYDLIVYAGLTHLLAKECGLNLGKLKFYFGNAHIYRNHIMDAIKLVKREPITEIADQPNMKPELILSSTLWDFDPKEARIIFYQPHPSVRFELNL